MKKQSRVFSKKLSSFVWTVQTPKIESGKIITLFSNYRIKRLFMCGKNFSVIYLKINGIVLNNIYIELI